MLYPQQNPARLCLSLDGLWQFALLAHEDGLKGETQHGYEWLAVPSAYNDLREMPDFRTHCGWAV